MSQQARLVDAVIIGRRSIRRFLDQPVDRETIEQILEVSARAPSGTNMQPWRVHVVAAETMKNLSRDILDAHYNHQSEHASEYEYYPDIFVEPFKSRRKKVGLDLYGLLGIEKGAVDKMQAQHGRNYVFFDAPVGLIFTIERTLKIGSWLDYGMFLQNIMIAARARGLDTCPQAAFAKYHRIIRDHLTVSNEQIVVCGMSLGLIDNTAIENRLETEREPVSGFARFYDL